MSLVTASGFFFFFLKNSSLSDLIGERKEKECANIRAINGLT